MQENQRDYVSSLFIEHAALIRGFVVSIAPNSELADDVIQETFLTVCSKANEFTRGSNFVAWACSIAKFKMMEESRRSGARGVLAPEVIEAICANAHFDKYAGNSAEQLVALKDCLNQLAPHTQRAFQLRYRNSHSAKQIANILNWSVKSVDVVLSRGRKALRNCINAKLKLDEYGF